MEFPANSVSVSATLAVMVTRLARGALINKLVAFVVKVTTSAYTASMTEMVAK